VLRSVLIGLLVLAIARPGLHSRTDQSLRQKRDVILLFDATYSSAQTVGVTTAFEIGKKMAGEVVRGLPAGTPISVAYLGHRAVPVLERSKDGPSVLEAIEKMQTSHGSGQMRSALEWVAGFMDENDLVNPEFFIFTDLQQSTWVGQAGGTGGGGDPLARISADCRVFIMDIGGGRLENFYVTNYFDAFIEGKKIDKDVKAKLTLYVNGKKASMKELKIGVGKSRISFPHKFLKGGEYVMRLVLEGDDLLLDNERYYLAHVPPGVRVLILDHGASIEDMLSRPSGLVESSISPPQKPGMERFSLFDVTIRDPIEISREILEDYTLVVMVNVRGLPGTLVSRLEQFVRDGGNLLVFVGDNVEPFEYNSKLCRKGRGILPCMLSAAASAREGEEPPCIAFGGSGETLFTHFAGRTQLEECRVKKYMPMMLKGEAGGGREGTVSYGRALANLSSGEVLMAEKIYGRGRVVAVNTTADGSWNTFPSSVDYPVFMQELLRYMIGNPDRPVNLMIGEKFEQPVLLSSQHLKLKTPRKESVRLTPKVPEGETVRQVSFDGTGTLGLYAIDTLPEVLSRRKFVVNLIPSEGDLTRLDEEQFRARFPEADVTFLDTDKPIKKLIEQFHASREFATVMLWLLFILVAVETYLAMTFGKRRV
jgi:hypothetical protein